MVRTICILVVAIIAIALTTYLAPEPIGAVVGLLSTGWAAYLGRVWSRITVDRGGLATGLIVLFLFAAGLHAFLRWLYAEMRPPDSQTGRRARWSPRWTGGIVAVLVLMFVAGIASVGIVHQAGWLAKASDSWTENRVDVSEDRARLALREMSFGVRVYAYGSQVKATDDPDVEARRLRLQSWQTLILPYLDVGIRSDGLNFDLPWNDPHNTPFFRRFVLVYLNGDVPVLRTAEGFAVSHYAGNERVIGASPRKFVVPAPDGDGNTILVGEVATDLRAWGDPKNLRDPALGIDRLPQGYGNPARGGVRFGMMDGSVRFVRDGVDPRVLRALATPDGKD